jgi:hypothetical protein
MRFTWDHKLAPALCAALGAALLSVAVGQGQSQRPALPPGFRALFNGQDLSGWQGVLPLPERQKLSTQPELLAQRQREANFQILPHWHVRDGILFYDGKGDSLQTIEDFGDFELQLEYKIEPGGDSGIYIRGVPQVQIWDPDQHPEGSGGLYNNEKYPNKPLRRADKPAGQWNHMRILVQGDRVTVYLNGVLVVDQVPLENYWARSQPLPKRGPIELQHHGSPLYFRNIYVKELGPSPEG